jgi:hypothetical protein
MGYLNEIGFYDEVLEKEDPSQKYIKYSLESQTRENITDGVILQKGRTRENIYKEEKRIEWLGVLNSRTSDESSGVHENFLHARAQNLVNINDSTKMTLVVELGNYFPGIYRGQVLPVRIFNFDRDTRQQNSGSQSNGESDTTGTPTLDVFLSGNYVVTGMSVNFTSSSGGMKQTLYLSKREWTANASGIVPKSFPIVPSKGIF